MANKAPKPPVVPSDELIVAPDEATLDPVAASTARSTRRVVLVVLLVLAVATAGLGFAWQRTGLWNPSWGSSANGSVCPSDDLTPAAPGGVRVNVYNASEQVGKATETAKALTQRGFKVGTVTNAQLPDGVRAGQGAILAGPDALDQALAIQRQVPGALVKLQPERTDGAVDLVLGDAFKRLVSATAVDLEPGQLRCERGSLR